MELDQDKIKKIIEFIYDSAFFDGWDSEVPEKYVMTVKNNCLNEFLEDNLNSIIEKLNE